MPGKAVACSVCQRPFVPGKTGADGKCGAHYRRAKRGSPNADKPERLRDGTRPCKIGGYVSHDVADRIKALAFAQQRSASDWVAEQVERALPEAEKVVGLRSVKSKR